MYKIPELTQLGAGRAVLGGYSLVSQGIRQETGATELSPSAGQPVWLGVVLDLPSHQVMELFGAGTREVSFRSKKQNGFPRA